MGQQKTLPGNKTLSGTYGELWWQGQKCFEMKKVTAKVTADREDVQFGVSKDSKIKSIAGEGEMVFTKVYTRAKPFLEAWKAGKDPRGQIITKLEDPDAVGEQAERWSLDNVWLKELPIIADWEKGSVVEETYPYGFTPSDAVCLDEINEA